MASVLYVGIIIWNIWEKHTAAAFLSAINQNSSLKCASGHAGMCATSASQARHVGYGVRCVSCFLHPSGPWAYVDQSLDAWSDLRDWPRGCSAKVSSSRGFFPRAREVSTGFQEGTADKALVRRRKGLPCRFVIWGAPLWKKLIGVILSRLSLRKL